MSMKKVFFQLAALISLTLSPIAFAQSNYELGSILTPTQISELGSMRSFNVGSAVFRILPSPSATGGNVINDQGKVGRCEGDVLISGIATDRAKAALSSYQSSIISEKTYDSLNMVSARFTNLENAANARNGLSNSLPDARVTMPILFALPQAR